MADGNETGPGRACPWCSAPVPPDATHCPACGDALAQRESIDDLAIPGVTTVDPVLGMLAGMHAGGVIRITPIATCLT